MNESRPSNYASVQNIVPLPPLNPNVRVRNPLKSFAAKVSDTAPLPNLRPDSVFNADTSPYANLSLGQLADDVTLGGFVCAHAMVAGEFDLVPNLHITLLKSVVDGKLVLELIDKDVTCFVLLW